MSATRGQGNEAQALRRFSAFEKFSDSELEQIYAAAHHSSHTAPWPLIHEQTPSDACFILLSTQFNISPLEVVVISVLIAATAWLIFYLIYVRGNR